LRIISGRATMRTLYILSAIAGLLLFSSCHKDKIEDKEDIWTWLAKVKDSCSYTIDGKAYTSVGKDGGGWGNFGMNLDTSNGQWKWAPDSLLYLTSFQFSSINNTGDKGSFELTFTKKYAKNQLVSSPYTAMLAPATDMDLYQLGLHKFAVEFERFNNDEGVVLAVDNQGGTFGEPLYSWSVAPVPYPTTITPQSHNNSVFEIVKVQPLPYGHAGHIIEARFSASVFNNKEQPKRVENGYVRFYTNG
jgi:hypothetical protein